MSETSNSAIKQSYYNSKKKIYTRNEIYYKISNTVEKFNAEIFSQWMKESLASSSIKNQKELAEKAKSDPATISRLINGAPQTTNNKPSQPPKDLVIRLAKLFEGDVNDALLLAGYAPLTALIPDELENIDFNVFNKSGLERLKYLIELLMKDGSNLADNKYPKTVSNLADRFEYEEDYINRIKKDRTK